VSAALGPGAARLAGVAARLLGWRPQEFWSSTPAELVAALAPPETAADPLGRDDLNRLLERER
jgi:hypothetical protein